MKAASVVEYATFYSNVAGTLVDMVKAYVDIDDIIIKLQFRHRLLQNEIFFFKLCFLYTLKTQTLD